MPVECLYQVVCDRLGAPPLDLVTVDEVHHLAVAQQRHGWAARLVLREVLPGPSGGLHVLSREHCHHLLRQHRVIQRQSQRGPGIAGGAAAHRVHEDQHGTLLVAQRGIHLFHRLELPGSETHHLLAHRCDEGGIVRHQLLLTSVGCSADRAALSACHGRLAHFTRVG